MLVTRRCFLAMLAVLPAGLSATGSSSSEREPAAEFELLRCVIAGFRYHDGPDLIDSLRPGQQLALVHEPDNRHDASAVRIRLGRHSLGYLPRTKNAAIARLLQQDAPLVCRVVSVERDAPVWERVTVTITLPSSIASWAS